MTHTDKWPSPYNWPDPMKPGEPMFADQSSLHAVCGPFDTAPSVVWWNPHTRAYTKESSVLSPQDMVAGKIVYVGVVLKRKKEKDMSRLVLVSDAPLSGIGNESVATENSQGFPGKEPPVTLKSLVAQINQLKDLLTPFAREAENFLPEKNGGDRQFVDGPQNIHADEVVLTLKELFPAYEFLHGPIPRKTENDTAYHPSLGNQLSPSASSGGI